MLENLANWAAVIGVPLGLVAIYLTFWQLFRSARTNEGQFLLELERMSLIHDDIHLKLRPGGEWAKADSGPKDYLEWAKLEDYMGFFEHCEILIKNGSLRFTNFKDIFGYRLKNIVRNDRIRCAKMIQEKTGWKQFIDLLERMDIDLIDE